MVIGAPNCQTILLYDFQQNSLPTAPCLHAYQSLTCETAINTDFGELLSVKRIYVKYKNAILSLIDCFFRTWKDNTYGQVLS